MTWYAQTAIIDALASAKLRVVAGEMHLGGITTRPADRWACVGSRHGQSGALASSCAVADDEGGADTCGSLRNNSRALWAAKP